MIFILKQNFIHKVTHILRQREQFIVRVKQQDIAIGIKNWPTQHIMWLKPNIKMRPFILFFKI
jgi:hypothetical protein